MNGLQLIDLTDATFMDKVLRREPRENAFVEINNLLACVPIFGLDRETINRSLEKYGISQDESRSRLLNFYSIVLKHFLGNEDLDKSQVERLHHLKYIFTLNDNEISSIHRNCVQPIYRMQVRRLIADGQLTEDEKAKLHDFAERLYIPKDYAKQIYSDEASAFLHSVLKKSLADGMLSDDEERELYRIAKNLQVELKFSETAEKNLERFRYLWRLYKGDIPKMRTPTGFNKGENCAASVKATLFQVQNSRKPVKFSGYQQLKLQNGFGFHSGVLRNDNLFEKTISLDDSGTLYFTSLKLHFVGTKGVGSFLYKNLSGGTFYKNGLLIESDRGNDRFFKFSGDMQAFKLIFDSLMTKSRK